MELRLLLGLCGRARHGKDFTATVIQENFQAMGLRCFTSSVSEEVLREAQRRGLIRPGLKRIDLSRAELDELVKLGHEGRAESEDFWLKKLEATISSIEPKVDVAIVSGIRFPNEINWLRSYHGVIGRVKRYNQDGSVFISPDRDGNNVMETCIERVVADYEISATTGQESWLKSQANGLAKYLLSCLLNLLILKKDSENALLHQIAQHWPKNSAEYQAFSNAKKRCGSTYPKHQNYFDRGIKFRFSSFEEFFIELGKCPKGLTLDRKDNDGHYEKGNVRWASYSEQNKNRRCTNDFIAATKRNAANALQKIDKEGMKKRGRALGQRNVATGRMKSLQAIGCQMANHRWHVKNKKPNSKCLLCKQEK